MRAHIQAISEQFSESSVPVWYHLDQKTLNSLVTLLSYSLQAAVTGYDFTTNSADITQEMESDSLTGENIRNAIADPNGCISDSSSGVFIKTSISTKPAMRLVDDILQTVSDLVRKNKHVSSHSLTFFALPFTYHKNPTSNAHLM